MSKVVVRGLRQNQEVIENLGFVEIFPEVYMQMTKQFLDQNARSKAENAQIGNVL